MLDPCPYAPESAGKRLAAVTAARTSHAPVSIAPGSRRHAPQTRGFMRVSCSAVGRVSPRTRHRRGAKRERSVHSRWRPGDLVVCEPGVDPELCGLPGDCSQHAGGRVGDEERGEPLLGGRPRRFKADAHRTSARSRLAGHEKHCVAALPLTAPTALRTRDPLRRGVSPFSSRRFTAGPLDYTSSPASKCVHLALSRTDAPRH